ncbi:hypothetical protein AAZX31_01G037100 [Glycine max]|uniref:CLAVATA3/ESR (CLE)-related protein 25 n=2 Tax=Glycine subgen. Soja TaxID=1462606 RepID=I1J5H3_SOYBN|nr:CLAVATA3/ESR (CLE)-related protein 34 [Glycine max]XP_028230327.1 CLAVATA3/ESR (CLE)-related protein 25-like [Glycine soja]KAG5059343.1 hypothetical protein JHK87_000372 [Glycine soja]KAG5067993.1 hypothetical protein JHK85_000370 [Glycine max]KAG5087755.1 hypothetical protein JHK86_000367 [Glycine max]KAH1161509.1 hypothetical protein GYH30_000403 [Glycine max]KHN01142.1 CLAVATA3/ESR (CLE)-related protein 25 [Glycine soja]|eukprot:NP_001340342.1 subtilisin CLE34 [Glycine max]
MGGNSSTTSSSSSSSSSFFLSRFLRALLVMGLVSLLVLGSLGSGEGTIHPTTQWSQERVKHERVVGRDKPVDRAELDFNYMSKRRVPNGPDPIHNRRAGNSGRPPGQA